MAKKKAETVFLVCEETGEEARRAGVTAVCIILIGQERSVFTSAEWMIVERPVDIVRDIEFEDTVVIDIAPGCSDTPGWIV